MPKSPFIYLLLKVLFFYFVEFPNFIPLLKEFFSIPGNPASGVKPMYQVHISPEKDKAQETNKAEKSEIRKHSIVKIDPKTLKPISEKAPETTSLSNHSSSNQILSNHNQTYQSLNSSTSNQSLLNCSLGMNNQSLGGSNQTDLKINTSSVSIFNPLKLQSSPKNDRKSPKSPHSPKLKAQATSSPTGSKRDKVRSGIVAR